MRKVSHTGITIASLAHYLCEARSLEFHSPSRICFLCTKVQTLDTSYSAIIDR